MKINRNKAAVISTAATILSKRHPNQANFQVRQEILIATFSYLCRNLPEDQPEATAKTIVEYLKRVKAHTRSNK